jgi:hypothetical protein
MKLKIVSRMKLISTRKGTQDEDGTSLIIRYDGSSRWAYRLEASLAAGALRGLL